MVWRNDQLTLYHGTVEPHAIDIEHNGPDLTKCRVRRDFGRGFYTTRRLAQAQDFANSRYRKMLHNFRHNPRIHADPICAAVVEQVIDRNTLGRLDSLAFVLPEPEWVDFVKNCRLGTFDHKGPGLYYDVVYGPVSTIANETGAHFEQLSFHSDAAIRSVQFVQVRRGRPWFS
jgi:hypothetical protein